MAKRTPAELIANWLASVGWSSSRLAGRAEVSESGLARVLNGSRGVGVELALRIERATSRAVESGEASGRISAVDLLHDEAADLVRWAMRRAA